MCPLPHPNPPVNENPFQSPETINTDTLPAKPPIPRLTKAWRFWGSAALTIVLAVLACECAVSVFIVRHGRGTMNASIPIIVGALLGGPGCFSLGLIGMRFRGKARNWMAIM